MWLKVNPLGYGVAIQLNYIEKIILFGDPPSVLAFAERGLLPGAGLTK